MATITEREGEVRIFTFKQGLLSAVAHDLEIAVTRFSISFDHGHTKVSATFDATSLHVLHPVVHGKPAPGKLSPRDLAKIESNIQSEVLHTQRHPEVRFESSSVTPEGDGYAIRGDLTLAGRSNDLRAVMRREGERWVTEIVLDQPRWGITPYSAMMGTLKIKPEVRVHVSVIVPS